jgi:hypothetical protein
VPSTAPRPVVGGGLALPAVVGALDTPVGKGKHPLPNELGRSEDGRDWRARGTAQSPHIQQIISGLHSCGGYPCNSTKAAFVGDNDLCTVIPDHPIIP